MADRNLLAKATDQSSSPTPGYLYNDIAKQAASSPTIASEIVSYLTRRLEKNNPYVKYKALKTISMVTENPNSRGIFKRTVVMDHQAVKEIKNCLNYRGRSDAVYGDELYERVRTQAKETLDVIYSDEPSKPTGGSGMQGISSSNQYGQPHGGGSYGASSSFSSASATPSGPKKMEGIGNPMFKDPRLDANTGKSIGEMTIGEVLNATKDGIIGIINDPLAKNVGSSHRPGQMHGRPNYGGQGSSGWSSAPPGQAQLQSATNGQWNMASNRGPNAIGSESYRTGGGNVASGVGGSWGSSVAASSRMAAHNPTNPNPVVHISGHPGAANTSGSHEKNIIMELCPPGGMKPEPPPDKLASFCQSLPSLNSDLVCPALLDLLEDGQPWIIRAKVLCVMEKAIQIGEQIAADNGGSNPYSDFFHMCREEVIPLAGHARAAVRDPAIRVLKLLGLDVDAPSFSTPAAQNNQLPVPAVEAHNLLEFDNDDGLHTAPPIPAEMPPAPPEPSIISNSSLFGGMTVKESNISATVPPASDPDQLARKSTDSHTGRSVSDDLLGVTEESHGIVPSEVPSNNVAFDDLTSACITENVSEEDNIGVSVSQSGFGFLNSSSSEKKPAQMNSMTFDPLLNPSVPSQTQPTVINSQMALLMQQQQQQIRLMQAQMQAMQMGNNPQMIMIQQQITRKPAPQIISSGKSVMGGMGSSGVNRSFAFFEDPKKVRQEESNKKFDFVLDAMKGAK